MLFKKFDMGFFSVVSLGIGSIVGAGIFALLGQVILMAGDRTYYSFVIAGIVAMFSGYSYAKLAAKYPDSGGLTDYFRIAFKSKWLIGFFTLIYVLTSAISISMMAKSFGIYAVDLLKNFGHFHFSINFFAVLLIVALAFLNMMGAADVGRTEMLLVGIKLFILVLLVAAAFWEYPPEVIPGIDHTPNLSFWGSIGITFFAYAGYGVMTNAAGDVENPKKTITHSIYATILIVMALYIGLAFVVLTYIPVPELNADANTAVAIASKKLLGNFGYAFIYIAAVMAFISGINATFFSIFRITHSLSQQHIFPHFYMVTFFRNGTWGNLLTTILIILATLFFDFNSIVNLSSGAYLVSYLAIFAANWRLRRETSSSWLLIALGFIAMSLIFVAFIANLLP